MINIISKTILLLLALGNIIFQPTSVSAQQYEMESGKSSFSVSAPAKTIYGESDKVHVQLDHTNGKLKLEVPVKSFRFTNNFMSDTLNDILYHRFNHYYMESTKYPKVIYNARIINNAAISFEQDGTYPIQTKGIATIHGVDQEATAEGVVTVKNGKITVIAKMVVHPTYYKIRIPTYIGGMYFKEVFIKVKGALIKSAH